MIRKEVPLWKCQVKRSMPFFTTVNPSSVERKPTILNTGRNGIIAVENPTKNYVTIEELVDNAHALHVRK